MTNPVYLDDAGNILEEDDPEIRAEHGAAYLDDNGPVRWRERIVPSLFDIDNSSQCVLGQVYKREYRLDPQGCDSPYEYAVKILGLSRPDKCYLGFESDYDVDELNTAWERILFGI